jgi:hypothetical protein
MHKLPMKNANKVKELNTIANIAEDNGYNRKEIIRLDNKMRINPHKRDTESKDQKKWVTFTYTGYYIRTITKLFKHTEVQIAFKTRNTIGNLLKETHDLNTFEQAGIYRLKCMDCQKVYIGQTGRTLNTRYKEHIRSIRYNRKDSGYATHILNNIHRYGKIEDIMERIDKARKGRIMNIKENFQIYIHKKQNILIEEQRAGTEDYTHILFDTAMTHLTRPQNPPPSNTAYGTHSQTSVADTAHGATLGDTTR